MFGELSRFFGSLSGVIDGFGAQARGVAKLLREDATTFAIVTSPELEPAREALFLAERLAQAGMTRGALIVNRVNSYGLHGQAPARAATLLESELGGPPGRARRCEPGRLRRARQARCGDRATARGHDAERTRPLRCRSSMPTCRISQGSRGSRVTCACWIEARRRDRGSRLRSRLRRIAARPAGASGVDQRLLGGARRRIGRRLALLRRRRPPPLVPRRARRRVGPAPGSGARRSRLATGPADSRRHRARAPVRRHAAWRCPRRSLARGPAPC